MSSDSDDNEDIWEPSPPELSEMATGTTLDVVPTKSKEIYLQCYQLFVDWQQSKKTSSFSENVILAYFAELSKTKKSSTLWKTYSMLRTTISVKNNIDLSRYAKLRAFLKKQSTGYVAKKSKTLTPEEVRKFIQEAPDNLYLATKVILVVGIMGACRKTELYQLKTKDIQDIGNAILISIANTKTNIAKKFTITGEFSDLFKKYAALRPKNADRDNFFLNFQKGRCTKQVMGINKFGGVPKQVALFLGLQNPELYTGHCLRRTSATFLIDSGGDVTTLINNRLNVSNKIMSYIGEQTQTASTYVCDKVEATTSTLNEAADQQHLEEAAVEIKQEEITSGDEAIFLHEFDENPLSGDCEFKIEATELDIKEEIVPFLEVLDDEALAPQPSTSRVNDPLTSRVNDPSTSRVNDPLTSHVKDPPRRCIFCSNGRKRVGRRVQFLSTCSSKTKINAMKQQAELLGDVNLIENLQDCDRFLYHAACDSSFTIAYKKCFEEKKNKQGSWDEIRHLHALAFECLAAFIQTEIIENEKIFYFSDLTSKYKAMLLEFNTHFLQEEVRKCASGHLEEKILKKFNKIIIGPSEKRKSKKIVFKQGVNISSLISELRLEQSAEKVLQQNLAYDIRNAVKCINPKKPPQSLKVENIIEGECDIPYELFDFMCDLIQGPDVRHKNSIDDLVKIKSICHDIIYVVTRGKVIPSKHLMLGLAMKSLTENRKVLTTLNKYGHAVDYSTAERLETDLTCAAEEDNALIPSGLSTINTRCTNVAFDTSSVGIIYQFASKPDGSRSDTVLPKPPASKRPRYEEMHPELFPYQKMPSYVTNLMPLKDILLAMSECKVSKYNSEMRNLLWVFSVTKLPPTPMWIGFNRQITDDDSEAQIVEYLSPPTSDTVVRDTMVDAQKIARECSQDEIVVTYNLKMTKKAMEIQIAEKPTFDNVFINLGAFHIEIAFFKAIGKYVDECGLMDILVETDVLAHGSISGVIESKQYKRCKKVHTLLSGALQLLHVERFCKEREINSDALIQDLKRVRDSSSTELPPLLVFIIQQYKKFAKETLKGVHGKTASFYMQYITFMNIFFSFSRSVRTSDFDLYVRCLYDMCDLFFAVNQTDYARWTLQYLSNLLHIKKQNGYLLNAFTRGAFGLKRTDAAFSRQPVDWTLDQTKNSSTSVSHLTNSIGARQRCMQTKIISTLFDEIAITHKDDTAPELQPRRIEQDNTKLQSIVRSIEQNINPFSTNVDDEHLFHLVTGRTVSETATSFLLHVAQVGGEQKVQFIKECNADPTRFQKPIQRNVVRNFASQSINIAQKSEDKEVLIKMKRGVFGRLLGVAFKTEVDIKHCLSFPLAPAPPAFCHSTGAMHKTEKASLTYELTSLVESAPPPHIDVDLIHGFHLLNNLGPQLPHTFEKIAQFIIRKICNSSASEIHLIFDRYFSPSIRNIKRDEIDTPYSIQDPTETRPSDFLKSLRNKKFKEALILFLYEECTKTTFAPILNNKILYITVEERCFSYVVINGNIVRTEEPNLTCYHEKADTRLLFHLSKLTIGRNSKIMLKSANPDVLIILLGNIHKFKQFQIYLTRYGLDPKKLNCVNCTTLSTVLGDSLCRALPGFHAFTGSKYTASFFRKGKLAPFRLFEKNSTVQNIFASLTDPSCLVDKERMEIIQQFTSSLYGIQNCKSVDLARYELFLKTFASKYGADSFVKKLTKFNPTTIPPCWKSLKQKVLRTIYINSMWVNATQRNCVQLNVVNCGWKLHDGRLEMVWFEGEPTPLRVEDIITELSREETNDELDSERISDNDSDDDSSSE